MLLSGHWLGLFSYESFLLTVPIWFWAPWVFLVLTEFQGESSVSLSQPIFYVARGTHRVSRRTLRVWRRAQWALSFEAALSKRCSVCFLSSRRELFFEFVFFLLGGGASKLLRESFCESGEGVRPPRERGWPPGKSRNFRGSLGNFRGSSGNFRGTLGFLLSSTVRELPGKSPKNFRGSFGDFPEARGSLTPSQRLAKFVSKLQTYLFVPCFQKVFSSLAQRTQPY